MQVSNIRKILIIQQRPFGDVLLATSYTEALRKKFPDATIDFFVSQPFDQVVAGHPLLHRIIISTAKGNLLPYLFGRFKAILTVICQHYDLAIDQQANAGSAIIVLCSLARYRLGWKYSRGGKYVCNLKATCGPERYHGNSNFDILAPLGISEQPYRLYYTIANASHEYIAAWMEKHSLTRKNFICVCTQSRIKSNRWSEDCFLEPKLSDLFANECFTRSKINFTPDISFR